jgi:pimeloyl-ACP methyl ester carboxylesterase
MAKTSIILCAGAWHTKIHIDPVIPFFEKAGYKIIPHTLLSTGGQSNTFAADVSAIRSVVTTELEAGNNVVPIFHSLAGLSGLEAINTITTITTITTGKLQRVILLASFLDVGPITEHLGRNAYIVPEPETGLIWTLHGEESFYNDMAPEDAKPFIDALASLAMYTDPPLLSSSRWQSETVTYLLCERDNAVPPEIGEKTAAEYGMQLVRMDAGHCPFVSQPEKFVSVVDGILRA